MAEYYTKPESDARFAPIEHSHNLEDLGGTGLYATQVRVPTELSSFYDNAIDLSDGLTSIKNKFNSIPEAPDLSGYALASHTHTPASIGASNSIHTHSQAEITGLSDALSSKANTTHTHTQNDVTGLASALSSKADASHTHTPSSIGAAEESHTHSYNSITGKPTIPTSLPANGGNADTVDNKHASDFAASDHNHDTAYMAKGLQFTDDTGNVEYSFPVGSEKNLLNEILTWDMGFHTAYSAAGVAGNPKTTESWRLMVHKTSSANGWVMAYGTSGSIYANYLDGPSGWKGWRCIVDFSPSPLWAPSSGTGGYYMTSGHTVTPTKPLDQCKNGWILVWSDYDTTNSTTCDYDFSTTLIPKIMPSGANWSGQFFLCHVPAGLSSESPWNESTFVKGVRVYNNKITGHDANNQGGRNDIVLRAVYEF